MKDPYEHSVMAPDGHLLTPAEYPLPPGEMYLGRAYQCDCEAMYHRSEKEKHRCLFSRGKRDTVSGIYKVNSCRATQWYDDERSAKDINALVGDAFDNSGKPEVNGERLHYKDWVLLFDSGGTIVMSDKDFHIMFYPDPEADAE